MPFPKGVKKVAAVFDRADVILTANERILGLLGIIDDGQAIILNKLDAILAKREFEPGGAHAWPDLRFALEDIFQVLYNNGVNETTHYGTVLTYLSYAQPRIDAIQTGVNAVGDAVGGVRLVVDGLAHRLNVYLPAAGAGTIGTAAPAAASGGLPLDEGTSLVLVAVSGIPASWAGYADDPPWYVRLGTISFSFAGRWGQVYPLHRSSEWIAVPPGAESLSWDMRAPMTCSVQLVAAAV